MIIKETIEINARIEKVWETFIDLSCWKKWNTVMHDVSTTSQKLTKGKEIFCRFRPFFFPIKVNISVEEIIPYKRIVWSAKKVGLFAYHEFIFEENERVVMVTSLEKFTGILAKGRCILLPKRKMIDLTKSFLKELKIAVES